MFHKIYICAFSAMLKYAIAVIIACDAIAALNNLIIIANFSITASVPEIIRLSFDYSPSILHITSILWDSVFGSLSKILKILV